MQQYNILLVESLKKHITGGDRRLLLIVIYKSPSFLIKGCRREQPSHRRNPGAFFIAVFKFIPTFADAIHILYRLSFLPRKYFHERNIDNCLA